MERCLLCQSRVSFTEHEMALIQNAARIARATELRNLAVDLVAIRGAMTDARAGNTKIQVMTFENERLAILYKTPRSDLSTEGAPAWIQPKGFMLDVWFDGRKTLSMQWDNEGPVDVFIFKPGEWEDLVTRALPET
ncbi:hypothetical protein AC630_37565 [Bradyrhizobium sp. AS23.2]|nr:hypothetical protein AC630_37565 [Bradyrhizobium sp. AS23.2]